ncbi:MAG: hypothetical protein CMJ78_06660 [Planctomycetaceae bacterium]|nr:hypothetical protein [Planctomycetaceae bacterium]
MSKVEVGCFQNWRFVRLSVTSSLDIPCSTLDIQFVINAIDRPSQLPLRTQPHGQSRQVSPELLTQTSQFDQVVGFGSTSRAPVAWREQRVDTMGAALYTGARLNQAAVQCLKYMMKS